MTQEEQSSQPFEQEDGAKAWDQLAAQPVGEHAQPTQEVSRIQSLLDPTGETAAQAAVPEKPYMPAREQTTEVVPPNGEGVGVNVVDEYLAHSGNGELTHEERTKIAVDNQKDVQAVLNPEPAPKTSEGSIVLPTVEAPGAQPNLSAALDAEPDQATVSNDENQVPLAGLSSGELPQQPIAEQPPEER